MACEIKIRSTSVKCHKGRTVDTTHHVNTFHFSFRVEMNIELLMSVYFYRKLEKCFYFHPIQWQPYETKYNIPFLIFALIRCKKNTHSFVLHVFDTSLDTLPLASTALEIYF